ncbi:glycogen debranching protein GlgX [Zafaria sp. J156]|uniref:glycogen debranching protein GlgX n=1 Tax=Zafaria sp. J156 TaxID=3116490 RepID=UPI002E760178|nr:glycogen debranching protein GlgX [Zafaria sp. J156]MEE1622023.1 glycogen debranching protein GlgX [Zafaria sp. J156]
MAQPTDEVPARLHGVHGHFSRPFPLGVAEAAPGVPDLPDAVNIAVFAPALESVDVWYTDPVGELACARLFDQTDGVHHGTVEGLRPGARYAFWAHGAELPGDGQLLVDPYARAIEEDDAGAYWGTHVETGFDWGQDRRPHVPWRDTVVYEAHVKGQTMLHPDVPEELRGTYAGFAHPAMIEYLTDLGVTTVELLPIHFHVDEPHLQELGLPNYWGYNTLGFFAPHTEYATAAARAAGPKAVQDELKGMIKLLHAAGIEVVLDVVFNHTAEGGKEQKTLSWRGLADGHYYRHTADGHYFDTTGCGNTLDFNEPAVVRMAMDSLRMWVEEYHVDGFRFDLAVSLGRDVNNHFTPQHPFLVALGASKSLTGTKLIAEPWDVAMGGWQTGRFPRGFADWNDKYRDTVREFWVADRGRLLAGEPGQSVAKLAGVLAGSREVFAPSGRGALASINFVTAHDGFTLRDLVSYDRKHNEDNGEENRDGHNHNNSFNHGVEGQTGDERVQSQRRQTASNVMATLLLSLGVPMITAGDEFGKTQEGNNNAYCQDNETTWLHWNLAGQQQAMLKTTRALLKIRREFLAGQPYTYPSREDSSYLLWFNAQGQPMPQEEWNNPDTRVVQLLLGSLSGKIDGLVVFNGGVEDVSVTMPTRLSLRDFRGNDRPLSGFELRFSTAPAAERRRGAVLHPGESDLIEANSVAVFRA